jgi:hypothetical protein
MRNDKATFTDANSPQKKKYFGIYRAKCLDNNDPKGQGRILAHIYVIDGKLSYDPSRHIWIPVLSQYGGVRQMGFFAIPPVHADGFVIFEGGDSNKPVWIGSYPFAAEKIVDEEASRTAGYTVLKIKPTVPQESAGDPSRMVIKTQYPTQQNPDPESDENNVENLIVMDEQKLRLLHVNQNFYEYNDGGVNNSQASSWLDLSDGAVTLAVTTNEGKTHSIQITGDGIRLQSDKGDYINVKDGSLELIGTENAQVKIRTGKNGAVTIDGKQVIVDGESLILGPPGATGGGGVVTCDTICPFVGAPIHIGSSKTIVGG